MLEQAFSWDLESALNCRRICKWLLLCSCLLSGIVWSDLSDTMLSDEFLKTAAARYDDDAHERFIAWRALIVAGRNQSERDRIHRANQFINRNIDYSTDSRHWRKEDYWATPIESLGSGYGDCEDYAIAKYFTLRAMGVADEKLRLMYVRALKVDEPHMVLIYFENPEDMPYVLDNLDPEIKSASRRSDLRPIYSFNASGLWMAKANGLGRKVNDGKGITAWTAVLEKIEQGQ